MNRFEKGWEMEGDMAIFRSVHTDGHADIRSESDSEGKSLQRIVPWTSDMIFNFMTIRNVISTRFVNMVAKTILGLGKPF